MNDLRQALTLLLLVSLVACTTDEQANRIVGQLASDRIELTAEVAEPITEIAVAEGTEVSAGQILVRQDAARASARLAEAEAVLEQAQARLDELVRGPRSEQIAAARANVDAATEELAFRTAENERIVRIHAQGLASPEMRDRAKNNFEAAQANLSLRRAQLDELLTGTTVEELHKPKQRSSRQRRGATQSGSTWSAIRYSHRLTALPTAACSKSASGHRRDSP